MPEQFSARVLLLTPTTRDAEVTGELLRRSRLQSVVCASTRELVQEFQLGAEAALVTEETLTAQGIEDFLHALQSQPTWSDFPLVMLMRGGVESPIATRVLQSLRNVTLLERPAPMRSVLSAVEAAVRGRIRQYQIRDLLESERAARASAEDANRIKDEFVANVSHELRTPLNAILGWAQILREGGNDPAEMAEGLEIIERNARVQAQLIEDLLDMSRIVSGKIRLSLEPIDPVQAVQAAIESVRLQANSRRLEIISALEPSATILGDPARLQQIVWNLLSNGIKFTRAPGKIFISLRKLNGDIEISVRDTGVGIAPQFLPYVFERFRQADASTTRRHGGLGLGLAIVKQLVELHGGAVTAKSPGVGRGAAFIVTIPTIHAQTRDPAERGILSRSPIPPECESADLRGVKVLVVDDDADSRALVKRMLSGCKAEVTIAASGREALQLLSESQPDVLLSDISMPEMDGYELIRKVRAVNDVARRSLPAAALTAFARSEDRHRALLAGFQSHLTKPVEPAELIAVVARLSGRSVVPVKAGDPD